MNILQTADKLVNGPRQKEYNHPAENFAHTAAMWSQIIGAEVTAKHNPLCMIDLKLCREMHFHKEDNLVDIAGYAQTLQMVHEREEEVESGA